MADATLRRDSVVAALEARAGAVERSVSPERVQPHSRLLPTEAERAQAQFAARQLRLAADDIRAGLEELD